MFASGGEVFRVRSKTLDMVPIASVERCSQTAIAASNVDHKSTDNAGTLHNVLRRSRKAIRTAD